MCSLQSTQRDICLVLDVTDKTLSRWCKETYNKTFSEIYAIKRELGNVSLRQTQRRLAERSAAMAIFLGKNYLNQTDKHGLEETPIDIEIKIQQLEKLKTETQLLQVKIDTLSKGGSAEDIVKALLNIQALTNNPIPNRDINEMLPDEEGAIPKESVETPNE